MTTRRRAGVLVRPDYEKKREVIRRSLQFGKTIRELEDFGYFDERLAVRSQWKDFSNRQIDKEFRLAAVDAYYDEYCREPTDTEYEEVECRLRKKYETNS